jgi:tetratricopeptide (TPR) repeat protein
MRHSFSTRFFRGLRAAGTAIAVTALAGTASSFCIWDTDTIRDEMQTKASDFDLIAGQFPHHSKGYYEARVKQAEAKLTTDPTDISARNNLAVALLKLGRWEQSLAQFQKIEAQAPGRYETLSNLGVLYKKWGKPAEAADYTAKALAIKPSGHLGLGDFYLKMLRWQADRKANPETVPTTSYLGYAYTASTWSVFPRNAKKAEREAWAERIKALVRSDRTFADAHFVLGDYYHTRWDLNLALWAYSRALQLGHPNPAACNARIAAIFKHWREAVKHRGGTVGAPAATVQAIQSKLTAYGAWQTKFEALEAEMIAAKGLANVDFATVEAALKARGVNRFRPEPNAKSWGAKGGPRNSSEPRSRGVEADGEPSEDQDAQKSKQAEKKLEKRKAPKKKSEAHGSAGAKGGK